VILHPGILALLLGGVVSLVLLGTGSWLGVRIARRWQPALADDQQLALERQCYLVATLVQWAVAFEALSLLLLLYTLDDLHPLFVGAMCATGTLNANPIGWHLLWTKLALFFLGSLWWVANRLDLQVPEAPLTRRKFLALLVLLPLAAADLGLMAVYFGGLHPEIITSCCGSLFSTAGGGVAAEFAALPMRPMIVAFYATAALYAALLLICRWRRGWGWRTALALAALLFGGTALVSVVAFISVYLYQLPSHHCPFDLLQGHYHFIGYPLYLFLFGAVLCGLVPHLQLLLRSSPPLAERLALLERRWLTAALLLLAGFLALVSWPLLFGEFTMKAYF
jgi:hypothetical protein